MNKNIVILGMPGSGKGTLSKLIASEFGYNIICTGDILRKMKNDSIGELLKNGNLISDEIMNELITTELNNTNKPFVLDGYPRTIAQAKYLDTIINIDLVILLKVSKQTIINRILERGKTSGRSDDLSIDTIKRRIIKYIKETKPLNAYYSKKSIVIDAEQPIEAVFFQAIHSSGIL